jgi:hypothetical protein
VTASRCSPAERTALSQHNNSPIALEARGRGRPSAWWCWPGIREGALRRRARHLAAPPRRRAPQPAHARALVPRRESERCMASALGKCREPLDRVVRSAGDGVSRSAARPAPGPLPLILSRSKDTHAPRAQSGGGRQPAARVGSPHAPRPSTGSG